MTDLPALPPIQSFEEFERESATILIAPFASKFGAVPWANMDAPGVQHRWLVKGLLTEGELAMLAGMSQAGKTFVVLDLAMSIARGQPWFGRKVSRGGVIYQAGEDPTGVRAKRIPAYRKANLLTPADEIPFVLLTGSLNLWQGEERTDEFIAECRHWSAQMAEPLRLVVIDTYAKATTGADEISGKDMGLALERCEKIRKALGCAVLLVDHMNADGGRVRGTANKTANIDAVLVCKLSKVQGAKRGDEETVKDSDGRMVREITNDVKFGGKIKNGEPLSKSLKFVLHGVEIGRDEDGDPITSCVVAPPAADELPSETATGRPRGIGSVRLSIALRALAQAIAKKGRKAPEHIPAPSHESCVTVTDWRDELAPMIQEEGEDQDKLRERSKKVRDRAAQELIDRGYIKKHGDWIWRTGRKAPGVDRIEPRPHSEPEREQPDLHPELQDAGDIPF